MRFLPLVLWLAAVGGAAAYYFASRPAASRPVHAASLQPQPNPKPPETKTEPPAKTVPPTVLGLPISGLKAADIPDTFEQSRGGDRRHEASDILAPRGTPVHAVVNGIVKKLFLSKPGGITLYQFDEREEFSYYYAHLDRYEDGIEEGRMLKKGDVLGYVGSTGNAHPKTPHLHFAIFLLKPDKKWWEGAPVNPYPLLLNAVQAELNP